ncbi:twin-arginine translocase subunit TatC [Fodinisporobacter ferrooxydans]|uniref:twin-arginine translocase subunit TatC n=1 Tax=Fodinisporobacter ferrooxydans TaxID=2901836 RepID=UPI003D322A98
MNLYLLEKYTDCTLLFTPTILLLFIIGVLFCYFIVFKMLLGVLLKYSYKNFNVMLTAANNFSFLIDITLPFEFFSNIFDRHVLNGNRYSYTDSFG